jgi:probable HAF family extracellular repeat protein
MSFGNSKAFKAMNSIEAISVHDANQSRQGELPAHGKRDYIYATLDNPLAAEGTNGTYAEGINDAGKIVGYYYDSAGLSHGFLYSGGNYITLDFGTNNQTFAEGINASGQIVGWYNDGSSDHGFLYSHGVFTVLDDPAATVNTVPTDINASGQIVGYYQNGLNNGGLVNHGFVYSNGIYTTLDHPLAGSNFGNGTANGTVALGINNKGQVVGYYFDVNGDQHGFLYADGNYTTIDHPQGAGHTAATDINNSGEIVGYYGDNLHNNAQHGFVYDSGTYTTLDDPSGVDTIATGITEPGTIVGHYLTSSPHFNHGFVTSNVPGASHIAEALLV